mmetsp:Transcript_19333/g.49183  ORF Transcript_19333/g.49183 Transcript_19333/m.49183 type:complete len:269 (-) Transcript_19333:1979-2785(-)
MHSWSQYLSLRKGWLTATAWPAPHACSHLCSTTLPSPRPEMIPEPRHQKSRNALPAQEHSLPHTSLLSLPSITHRSLPIRVQALDQKQVSPVLGQRSWHQPPGLGCAAITASGGEPASSGPSEPEGPHLRLGLQLAQLLHQLALVAAQALGDLDAHVHLVVAAQRGVAQARHAALGHEQRGAGLRAGGDLELHGAVHRGHLDLRAQDGVHVADLHIRVDGGAVATQLGVLLDRDVHVQVARLAAAAARVALAAHAQPRPAVHAGGHLE